MMDSPFHGELTPKIRRLILVERSPWYNKQKDGEDMLDVLEKAQTPAKPISK